MSITAKAKVIVIVLLTILFVSIASAGQVDPRFDGKWVGLEAFRSTTVGVSWRVPQRPTVIGIAQSGKALAVLSGFLPGRYPQISTQSGRNILIFYGSNGFEERKYCRLKLSADGNTFEEMGSVIIRVRAPGYLMPAQVWGTFHRVGK
jgi:hypothetical protein